MNHSERDLPKVFDFYKKIEKNQNVGLKNLYDGLDKELNKIYVSKRLQVVIFDLDIKATRTLSSLLKSSYEVFCCNSEAAALKLISTKRIALVISAQVLPYLNVSGIDFLKKVKTIAPLTSRILVAGVLDFGKAKYSLEKDDVFKLVKKPFEDNRMLTTINSAVDLYLEKTGALASTVAQMQQNSPNITKPIEVAKTISPLANPVMVLSSDSVFFDEVKDNYQDKAFFIHAKNKEEMIKVLTSTVTKVLIYCFDNASVSVDSEIHFLEQIKQELPSLIIITMMDKDKINYQQTMSLLTKKIIFDYLPINTKLEKLYQKLTAAIELSNRLYQGPIYLVWPPLERFEKKEKADANVDALKDMHSKVKDGVLSSIATVKGIFKRKTK